MSGIVLEQYLAWKERSVRDVPAEEGAELDAKLLAYVKTRKVVIEILHRFFGKPGLSLIQETYDSLDDRAVLESLRRRLTRAPRGSSPTSASPPRSRFWCRLPRASSPALPAPPPCNPDGNAAPTFPGPGEAQLRIRPSVKPHHAEPPSSFMRRSWRRERDGGSRLVSPGNTISFRVLQSCDFRCLEHTMDQAVSLHGAPLQSLSGQASASRCSRRSDRVRFPHNQSSRGEPLLPHSHSPHMDRGSSHPVGSRVVQALSKVVPA